MKIVHNPADGAPITSFISQGIMIDPFYPDGYEKTDGTTANGLMQFDDKVADELVETYGFLTFLTAEEAQDRINRPTDAKYKCDFPECEFSSVAKIGLAGHQRKHAKEIALRSQPIVDATLIPVAGGRKVLTLAQRKEMSNNMNGEDLPTGSDPDGVEWYGDGVRVENHNDSSFSNVKAPGKGHFVG